MWTKHTRYNFHAECNDSQLTRGAVAAAIERETSLCTMVSDYVGAWQGNVSEGFLVTWIAPCDLLEEQEQGLFELLEDTICDLTGNHCLMPTRESIEVNCRC